MACRYDASVLLWPREGGADTSSRGDVPAAATSPADGDGTDSSGRRVRNRPNDAECEWTGRFDEWVRHSARICALVKVSCDKPGCEALVHRKDLEHHQNSGPCVTAVLRLEMKQVAEEEKAEMEDHVKKLKEKFQTAKLPLPSLFVDESFMRGGGEQPMTPKEPPIEPSLRKAAGRTLSFRKRNGMRCKCSCCAWGEASLWDDQHEMRFLFGS